MGIDCTLFVVAGYSRDTAYAAMTIELNRERDLWRKLEALPSEKKWSRIQVPRGSWVTYSDGTKPADQDDRELGYLFTDSYDAPLRSVRSGDLRSVTSEYPSNASALAFVADQYPDHDVILIWH